MVLVVAGAARAVLVVVAAARTEVVAVLDTWTVVAVVEVVVEAGREVVVVASTRVVEVLVVDWTPPDALTSPLGRPRETSNTSVPRASRASPYSRTFRR
ncbi:MAG: hypothetical protein M3450_04610 [Actinomycetota bacterium]|nr:hypothetical protein [Actinomycetota bacterium]